MEDDQRFASLKQNPRFVRPKRNTTKVSIDDRFKSVLKSKDFESAGRDRYGRRVESQDATSNLGRFYNLEDDNQEEEESKKDDIDVAEYDGAALIRGEIVLESSDEEIEDNDIAEEEEEIEDESEKKLGSFTKRFAAVKMDWDHIKAKDLYKAFDAFKPPGTSLLSVAIYKSEFGKERLAKVGHRLAPRLFTNLHFQEAEEGPPREIFQTTDESQPLFENSEANDFNEVQLRKYQLDRLKYYYAIVDCDSISTAKAVYEACDGREFEKSANFFDLQFVPDEMEFEDPVDVVNENPSTYEPASFVTQALQHSKVELTWDQDDPDRVRITRRKFTKGDLQEMDFKAYLASDSEEEDEDADGHTIQKYRSLLNSADNGQFGFDEKGGEDDVDMEITFTPGLSENAEKKLRDIQKTKEENVFEAERRRRKEKIKERKASTKKGLEGNCCIFSRATVALIPIHKDNDNQEKTSVQAVTDAELDLLLWNGDDNRSRHFDMKDILKAEKQKALPKKKQKPIAASQGDFAVNVEDDRFAQIHTSHEFAIDPTNPNFKKTEAMKKILASRNLKKSRNFAEDTKAKAPAKVEEDKKAKIAGLVASVKRKHEMAASAKTGKRSKM
ncbi:pre-rRNA-processing protein esf1 [Blyttiomyces sp. JEL0837]|nr:pre-rRNA-processing protein esf1 [Blyttiomyces sp. JEL0837]